MATHMGRQRAISVLLALALSSAGVSAAAAAKTQAAAPERLSLGRAIEEALARSPRLSAVRERSAAAAYEASAAARSRWGSLSAVGSYKWLNDAQILRVMSRELVGKGITGMPFDRSQLHYGLVYEIPLYLGGKLYNQIKIAELEKEKAAVLAEGARWQTRFNVISIYTAVQTAEAVSGALDEQLAALGKTKARIDQMVALGKRPEADRLKVIDEIESVRSARAEAWAQRQRAAALLLALLGREEFAPVAVDPISEAAPALMMDRSRLEAFLEKNSAARRADLTARQAERRVRTARSEFLPRVFAGADLQEHSGLESDRDLDTWSLGVSVSIPIFEGTTRIQRLAAAKRAREAAVIEARKTRLDLRAELEGALAGFDAAKAKVASGRARVAAAQEAARIERIRYETQAGTIEDLLRAEARLESAKAALAAALAERLRAAERINAIVEEEAVK